jgi:regulator of CtrA degradation
MYRVEEAAMTDQTTSAAGIEPTIAFAERFAGSETFRDLFREGMALVEETAAYLDGPGRLESRDLDRTAQLAYTTESMRLTTRLMQMASWLLLQRAVNEGELSLHQAGQEKSKVRLDGPVSAVDAPTFQALPDTLRALVERSNRLQERLRHIDGAIYGPGPGPEAANPVASSLDRLADAFGRR